MVIDNSLSLFGTCFPTVPVILNNHLSSTQKVGSSHNASICCLPSFSNSLRQIRLISLEDQIEDFNNLNNDPGYSSVSFTLAYFVSDRST